jgi:hypothetical protein
MTTADKTARRVYSAEQLHRLRASFSAPKLREAIEEHDGEDAELVKGVSSSRYITRLLLLLHLPSRLHGQPQVASPIKKKQATRLAPQHAFTPARNPHAIYHSQSRPRLVITIPHGDALT